MALEHESDTAIALAVRKAGSQSAFGRLIGRSQSTVREWLLKGEMPADDVPKVSAKTGIPRHALRPDLWEPGATEADLLPQAARSDNRRTGGLETLP